MLVTNDGKKFYVKKIRIAANISYNILTRRYSDCILQMKKMRIAAKISCGGILVSKKRISEQIDIKEG